MTRPLDLGRPGPRAWRECRLKDVAPSINRGIAPAYADYDTGWVAFNQKCVRPDLSVAPELGRPIAEGSVDPESPALLREGDVVVNSTGRGTLGRAALVRGLRDLSLVADGHVTVVRVDESLACARFMAYLLGTDAFYEQANSCLAVGATNQTELNREAIRAVHVRLPARGEQERIADYLDAEEAAAK